METNAMFQPDEFGAQTLLPEVDMKAMAETWQDMEIGEHYEAELDFWRTRFGIAGRNSAPGMMSEAYYEGDMCQHVLKRIILDVWEGAEFPQRCLDEDEWTDLFRTAGFVSDDGRPEPTEPVTVYRGAPIESQGIGLSWTMDRDKAEWFANRNDLFGYPAAVFVVEVEPDAILAMVGFSEESRGEQEVILDPGFLIPAPGPHSSKAKTNEVRRL